MRDSSVLYSLATSERQGCLGRLCRAGSFGLAAIPSRIGFIAEVIDHGVTGFLVPPAISLAMERFAADRSLALRMGAAARAAFRARFTLERFQAQVGRVYQEALEI